MASILFYTSIKTRVKDQESLMKEFVRQGHTVLFLNQQPNEYLPTICNEVGVRYHLASKPIVNRPIFRIVHYSVQLFFFIWRNKIDLVYSHLEPANFIAVIVQYFIKAKVVIVRHHHDLAELAGFSTDRSYRLTYKLAKSIITVSESTKRYMIDKETVTGSKITHINLGYDFSLFGNINNRIVDRLREETKGKISLITIGRLDKYKRPDVSIELVKKLNEYGIETHLRLLGTGELKDYLERLIKQNNLEGQIEFVGYSNDVLSYLKASDWLIHPSVSESSCVVIKEAGVAKTPIIVCKSVGDVDEYLIDGQNAMLVSIERFVEEASEVIIRSRDTQVKNTLGESLCQTIYERFHISLVIKAYNSFMTA